MNLTTAMTLEAWVRPTAGTGWRSVILKEGPGVLSYALYAANNASRPGGWIHNAATDPSVLGTAAVALASGPSQPHPGREASSIRAGILRKARGGHVASCFETPRDVLARHVKQATLKTSMFAGIRPGEFAGWLSTLTGRCTTSGWAAVVR